MILKNGQQVTWAIADHKAVGGIYQSSFKQIELFL